MTTPTPRTDAKTVSVVINGPDPDSHNTVTVNPTKYGAGRYVEADFARQLERELAQAHSENEEQARLLDMGATREAKLRADIDAMMRDLRSLLSLLAEIREATGDNGRRMQDELVAYCADLAKRAAVLEKVRAYPYIPSGLAAMIERELNTTTP